MFQFLFRDFNFPYNADLALGILFQLLFRDFYENGVKITEIQLVGFSFSLEISLTWLMMLQLQDTYA